MSEIIESNRSGSMEDLLTQSLLLASDLLSNMLLSIDLLPREENQFQNPSLIQLSSDISQFVEITTLTARLIRHLKRSFVAELKEAHINLLFIVKAINQAQQKQDLVALLDLIKYELRDNLTQWKIDFIPQIKRLIHN